MAFTRSKKDKSEAPETREETMATPPESRTDLEGIAARTEATNEPETDTFRTTITVSGLNADQLNEALSDEDFLQRQHNAVRTEAINNGLRPQGFVTYDGLDEDQPDDQTKNATRLKFSVPVILAWDESVENDPFHGKGNQTPAAEQWLEGDSEPSEG